MLYNKFKSMFLVGEGDCVLSQVLNKSLAEQRQHEEAKKGALKRVETVKENGGGTVHFFIFFFIPFFGRRNSWRVCVRTPVICMKTLTMNIYWTEKGLVAWMSRDFGIKLHNILKSNSSPNMHIIDGC